MITAQSFVFILLAVAMAPSAPAATDTGMQNPDLTVSASADFQGTLNPDVAMAGDKVRVILAVESNKEFDPFGGRFKADEVGLRITLQSPIAEPQAASFTIFLFPEQELSVPFEYTVAEFIPPGEYALTLEAIEAADAAAPPSTATAAIAIL